MTEKEQVLGTFNAINNALMSNDTKALKELIAENYRGFNLRGGVEGKELILEAYKPGGVRLHQLDVKDVVVEVIGDVGIVTRQGYISGDFGAHNFAHNVRSLEIYVKRGSKWKYYISHVTEIE